MLWDCQAEEEEHAREPKTQDSQSEMGRGDLNKDQVWFESNWMDQTDVCILTNIHDLPQKAGFHDEMATW